MLLFIAIETWKSYVVFDLKAGVYRVYYFNIFNP